MRRLFRSLALPSLALATLIATRPACADELSPYGINVHAPAGAQLTAQLDRVERAGIGWIRIDFIWAAVQPQRGVYDWRLYDALVAAAEKRGLSILAIAGYTPQWATDGAEVNGVPRDVADWTSFCTKAAQRYRGRIAVWEVWNEPNLTKFWAGTRQQWWQQVLIPGADAIHAADPQAKVGGAGARPHRLARLAPLAARDAADRRRPHRRRHPPPLRRRQLRRRHHQARRLDAVRQPPQPLEPGGAVGARGAQGGRRARQALLAHRDGVGERGGGRGRAGRRVPRPARPLAHRHGAAHLDPEGVLLRAAGRHRRLQLGRAARRRHAEAGLRQLPQLHHRAPDGARAAVARRPLRRCRRPGARPTGAPASARRCPSRARAAASGSSARATPSWW